VTKIALPLPPGNPQSSSSHTNPRSKKQTEKKPVVDVFKLDDIFQNGKAEDQFKYGQMFEEGNGVDRDYAKALNWYHRAADQNHPEAQFKLGVIYANGLGTEKNVDRALHGYSRRLRKVMLRLRVFMTLWFLAKI
jgi:TPR repeat protein